MSVELAIIIPILAYAVGFINGALFAGGLCLKNRKRNK